MNEVVYNDGAVYEQPVGRPNNGRITVIGDQNINQSGTVTFYPFALNASHIMVSTESDFAGATFQDLVYSMTMALSATGNNTIYFKFQNPAQEQGGSGSKQIRYDPAGTEHWDYLMKTAGATIQREYETYKLRSSLPRIEQVILGEPEDIQDSLPILGVEWQEGEFDYTDGTQQTGSMQKLEMILHVLALDDVNAQDDQLKHSRVLDTLQGVCRVLKNNPTLDGLFSRMVTETVERVPYGAGRTVLGGEIRTRVLFQSDSI